MVKEIPLTQGKVALVDDEDYEIIKNINFYAVNYQGWWYANTRNGKSHVLMHRLILDLKKEEFCDHINGDGLDNRRCNLRPATRSQSSMNQRKPSGRTSQYKGTSWNNDNNRWFAQIRVNRILFHLGSFMSEVEAAKAYDKEAKVRFGEYSRLNFPEVTKNE